MLIGGSGFEALWSMDCLHPHLEQLGQRRRYHWVQCDSLESIALAAWVQQGLRWHIGLAE